MTRQFVAVVPEHVQAHGQSAALLLAHIAYLTRRQPDGVVATVQDLAAGTGMTLRTVERAAARLRDRGLVTVERAEAWNPTKRWRVVTATPGSDGQPGVHVTATLAGSLTATLAGTSVPLEVSEVEQAPLAPTEQGTLPFLVVVPDPPAPSDEGPKCATDDGPPKTAQTLVARWVDGYRSVNDGQDPHRAVMGRVAGQARNLAKACGEDHTAWVDAWHACHAAGVAGSHDLVRYLVPQQQRRQDTRRAGGNAFAAQAMGGPTPETVARFSSLMSGDQPRAIGGGA